MPFDGLTDDQLRESAPSIFATHAAKNTSDRYAYLPSYQVVRALRAVGLEPVRAYEGKKRQPEGRAYAMHNIVFRRKNDWMRAPELGELTPEIHLLNSHDTTSPLAFDAGLMRAICTNGMRTDDVSLGGFKVRHTGKDRMDQLHKGMQVMIANLDRMIEVAQAWSRIQLTPFQADRFAQRALDVKGTSLSISPQELLSVQRRQDEGSDLWHVFNRVQENITKGGAAGHTASGKRASLKAISTLASSVDFNRGLWALASSLAREIKPAIVSVG